MHRAHGSGRFKEPGGVLIGRQAERAPCPGRPAASEQGPLSAAFPAAPPLCLPPADPTYRCRASGIRGLPHHRGRTEGRGRGAWGGGGPFRSQPPPRPRMQRTLTPKAERRGRQRKELLRTLPHDPETSGGTALWLAGAAATQREGAQSAKAFLGRSVHWSPGARPRVWSGSVQ